MKALYCLPYAIICGAIMIDRYKSGSYKSAVLFCGAMCLYLGLFLGSNFKVYLN